MKREIERKLSNCLTVKELIQELEYLHLPPDAKVIFACDYGDYCHTTQALPVETVDVAIEADLTDSAYSRSGVALSDPDRESAKEGRNAPVVILR